VPYRRKKLTFAISSPDEFLCLIMSCFEAINGCQLVITVVWSVYRDIAASNVKVNGLELLGLFFNAGRDLSRPSK